MASAIPTSTAGFGSMLAGGIAISVVIVLLVVGLVLLAALYWRKAIRLVSAKNSQTPESEKPLPAQPGHARTPSASSQASSKRSHPHKSSTKTAAAWQDSSLEKELEVERVETTTRTPAVELASTETPTKDSLWSMRRFLPRTIALLNRGQEAMGRQVEVKPATGEPQKPAPLELATGANEHSSKGASRHLVDRISTLSQNLSVDRMLKGKTRTQQPPSGLQLPPIAATGDDSSWRMSRLA